MFHLFTVKEETFQLLQKIFTVEAIQKQFALAGGTFWLYKLVIDIQ